MTKFEKYTFILTICAAILGLGFTLGVIYFVLSIFGG